MNEQRRIALVTGANRGIGLEISRQLARAGLHVLVAARSRDGGEAAVSELAREGLESTFIELDVSKPESITAAHREIGRRFDGRVDVLVNNAGVSRDKALSGSTSFFAMKVPALEATLATNLYGPLLLCQAFVPGMVERRYGRVVNVSSGMGQLADMEGGWPAYRISKTALNALTRIVASEAAGANVLVNAICPGWVRTAMGGESAPRSVEEGARSVVWGALLPDGGPTGGFFRDGRPLAW